MAMDRSSAENQYEPPSLAPHHKDLDCRRATFRRIGTVYRSGTGSNAQSHR
jgi:hypothetical protein